MSESAHDSGQDLLGEKPVTVGVMQSVTGTDLVFMHALIQMVLGPVELQTQILLLGGSFDLHSRLLPLFSTHSQTHPQSTCPVME